ncbi:uncharacterized protein PHACADRAFT_141668 [Phanerochaete carnosa HHB-10118-sp]|uniref:AB hydrolase-1 domain-containing protein n=1 Tax=Phanerochaete carnosa (strain HHB-10118-sp) TaxID=650164 RepID=K5WCM1_PHACS|nr:uncharacterized protein PHACADRAFT_141668 [Phanerochaete carnosa HHB-10118-sp]EKM56754.1 hypothetical protein PHACADRAFT_141668 [Phanerochaete carnosa HHB-10118-sp]
MTMYTTSLNYESYIFDSRPRYPLLITAKRYWHPEHCSTETDAVTLILAHGAGFHKEHWEPTLEHVYERLKEPENAFGVKVREAWSIECPNHGDAAVLNEDALTWGYLPTFSWEEYARSIHAVLTGLGQGIDVDFSRRRLVGVGHSMGAIALMLADTYFPTLKFASLILVGPALLHKLHPGELQPDPATPAAKRRDIWPSREEALKALQSRPPFKTWDPRILELYVEHGMRELPTAVYPDKADGVTLKCPRKQEVACYLSDIGRARAYNYLHHLCVTLPVHIIFGTINDLFSVAHQYILTVAAKEKYATVSKVDGAGHLVPQMQPKGLADAVFAAMRHDISTSFVPGSSLSSKL